MDFYNEDDPLDSPIRRNKNGGLFYNGRKYDFAKRVLVLESFFNILFQDGAIKANKLAKASQVSVDFAAQFIKAFRTGQDVLGPTQQLPRNSYVGMYVLDKESEELLLNMRRNNNQTSLAMYQDALFQILGKTVSTATISRWFHRRFPHKGKMRVSNLVPIDKFSTNNILRRFKYQQLINQLDITKVKYADECHRRGS